MATRKRKKQTLNVYRIEIQVAATAYIKAASAAKALAKAERMKGDGMEVCDTGPLICGLPFDDPELPAVSLSPAMTIHGLWPDDRTAELVKEGV